MITNYDMEKIYTILKKKLDNCKNICISKIANNQWEFEFLSEDNLHIKFLAILLPTAETFAENVLTSYQLLLSLRRAEIIGREKYRQSILEKEQKLIDTCSLIIASHTDPNNIEWRRDKERRIDAVIIALDRYINGLEINEWFD